MSDKIAEMIRVNHAGEYAAKRIYEGQLAILKNTPDEAVIEHMKSQELEHLEYFEQQMITRRVRPSLLSPFWHIAGYALGVGTAMLGPKAAYACTEAVEEVIEQHYLEQIEELAENEPELSAKISKFLADEVEHKNTAQNHHAKAAVGYPYLTSIIKFGCKCAIRIAKHI